METYSEMINEMILLSPGALTQAIRNFAKSLESWLTNAMMNIPEEMVRIKVHSPCISLKLLEQHVFWAMEQAVWGLQDQPLQKPTFVI